MTSGVFSEVKIGGSSSCVIFGFGFVKFFLCNVFFFFFLGLFASGRKVREIGVDELDAALGAADYDLEAGDFLVQFGENAVAGQEFGAGVGHGLDLEELGREVAAGGFVAVLYQGEVPLDGDAAVEAVDLPAGGGHVADGGEGGLVERFVDGDEVVDELHVEVAVLIAHDDFVRRDEVGEFIGAGAVL